MTGRPGWTGPIGAPMAAIGRSVAAARQGKRDDRGEVSKAYIPLSRRIFSSG